MGIDIEHSHISLEKYAKGISSWMTKTNVDSHLVDVLRREGEEEEEEPIIRRTIEVQSVGRAEEMIRVE